MKKIPTWIEVQDQYTENTLKAKAVTESDIMDVCASYAHCHGADKLADTRLSDILYELSVYYDDGRVI